jgi:hypothetical protein|tara:strand:- start:30840 stop:30992 length:153 start_codon:yes stop_codon:yes gene_type:complete
VPLIAEGKVWQKKLRSGGGVVPEECAVDCVVASEERGIEGVEKNEQNAAR